MTDLSALRASQHVVVDHPRGRIVTMGSAYDVDEANRGHDVVVNASYCGVLPARFISEYMPRGAIGVDCAVGPAGASIAGLWYLEALHIPAAVADIMTVRLGDGDDLYEQGIISYANQAAADCGVEPNMRVETAAEFMLLSDPAKLSAEEITHRTIIRTREDGRMIVCADSIRFGIASDRNHVLLTAGHGGLSALPYLRRCRPRGWIGSDGGIGREQAGVAGAVEAANDGLAVALVDARTAAMGSGLSTWSDGIISFRNDPAASVGVEVGQTSAVAAELLLDYEISSVGP